MKNRSISTLLFANTISMGGLPVKQPFPTQRVEQLDPFLLLHHHKMGPDPDGTWEGVGAHPHRGFSPVTFIFEGALRHRDSRGNDSVISAGGVQWMNAGMGIVHSERPANATQGLEIIQLWINTPSEHKMDQPAYFAVSKEDAGNFSSADGLIAAHVFAGELLGAKGKI